MDIENGDKDDVWLWLGMRIRNLRRSQRISVGELAREAGLSRQQVVRLESGLTGTTLPRLFRIAKALHVKLSNLLSDEWLEDSIDPHRDMLRAFRTRGLTQKEIDKIVEYINLLELGREHDFL